MAEDMAEDTAKGLATDLAAGTATGTAAGTAMDKAAGMTMARLKRAKRLAREIACLKDELDSMLGTVDGISSDTILDYRKGYGVPRSITGFDWARYDRRRELLAKKQREMNAVAAWVDGIDDVQAQAVIRMRYIDGLNWKRIARRIGVPQNEDYPRVCIQDAYFKRVGIKPPAEQTRHL